MEQLIKIAVIGGTGKSGKFLVKALVKQGFHFKMLVRNIESRQASNLPSENSKVEIINGDANDYEAIHSLIDGCQAVISTLGLGIPASEKTLFSQASTHIIRAMNECNIRRYVVITGLNVDTHLDKKSPKTTFATSWMYENYPISTKNRQTEYEILSTCNIDWTLLRLPLIEQTDARNAIKTSLEDCEGDKISAADLAHFLIEQLNDETFVRKAPFLWSL
jgi:putative NADH-flavin reductase